MGNLIKDIKELVEENVISKDTAVKITEYYNTKKKDSKNRLFVIFGVLGALLVGLGIVLIVAHNWDNFSKITKTIMAFIPLLLGQFLSGYALLKKTDSTVWREVSAVFLFFAIGANISLISQIYHMNGSLTNFVLVWMLLSLPLVYVMKSSFISLLYIVGITFYACNSGYWTYPNVEPYLFWVLLIAIMPHYYTLYKTHSQSNFFIFHNWLIPLSLIIVLGTVAATSSVLLNVAYFNLFGLFYLIGKTPFFSHQQSKNSYLILGSSGMIVLLLIASFDGFWEHIQRTFTGEKLLRAPEFLSSVILFMSSLTILIRTPNKTHWKNTPLKYLSIVYTFLFIIGIFSSIPVILVNVLILGIGIHSIGEGVSRHHLGLLNYGLLIITALIISRFFDTDLNFIIRGLLFVMVGVGFFVTNYWMLKKRD